MSKIKIYCAFSGAGKTYFCQHHLGWIDLDEEHYHLTKTDPSVMLTSFWCYNKNGYKILTCASKYVLLALSQYPEIFEIVLILPKPDIKDEVIRRIQSRGNPDWAYTLENYYYEEWYNFANSLDCIKYYFDRDEYLINVFEREGII